MREILFRGKRIDNGEWVEGYYFYQRESATDRRTYFIVTNKGFGFCWNKVRHETICEYTGLTDKNGNKIVEGDIVQGEAEEARGVVEWQQAECRYLVSVRNGYDWLCMDDDKWEIIGNIYDNKELLEK